MMGHSVAALLVAAAAGYWVLTQSEKEKNRVKKLGQLLGFGIILISVLSAVCKIYYQISNCPSGPMGGMMCPFTGKSAPPPAGK